jgi:precorrin-2 dehydrogenase/sirohydrochlorin ferrochelatase
MGYLPISLRLDGRHCVVIGGGEVAQRKATSLLVAGARVTVVAPEITAGLRELAATHEIVHYPRAYRRGDLKDVFLAIAATDDPTMQRAVASEASAEGVLLNVADVPDLCTFIMPSVLRRGALSIAVSTDGASPALARRIRERLEGEFEPEYDTLTRILLGVRSRLPPGPARQDLLARLVDSPILEWLRAGRIADVRRLLRDEAGLEGVLTEIEAQAADRGPIES